MINEKLQILYIFNPLSFLSLLFLLSLFFLAFFFLALILIIFYPASEEQFGSLMTFLLLFAFGKELGSSACVEFHIKYLDLLMS